MAIPTNELQQMLDDLKRAKYTGQRSIRLADGREITYGSMNELTAAIADLQEELDKSANTQVPSFTLAQHSRE